MNLFLKIYKKLDWWMDCYFWVNFYNDRKFHRYNKYMMDKWPEKFKEYNEKSTGPQ
jgi:hypothetical protein